MLPLFVTTGHPLSDNIACHWPGQVYAGDTFDKQATAPYSIACYGILRGNAERMQRSPDYWYIDHGYLSPRANNISEYYRVVHNRLWHDYSPDDRFDASRLIALVDSGTTRIKFWRKTGSHIVIVPPTVHMDRLWRRHGWRQATVEALRKFTDRPIVVHSKDSAVPLSHMLKDAWCLVTDHSNAAIQAVLNGIPAISTHYDRRLGKLSDIENPPMRRDFLSKLANNQFTLQEIRDGMPLSVIQQQVSTNNVCEPRRFPGIHRV